MIIEALHHHLQFCRAVTDIVGGRIFTNHLPQGLNLKAHTPAISFFLVSTDYLYDLGEVKTLATARVQIDCWSYDSTEVVQLATILRIALAGRHSFWVGPLYVAGAKLIDERNLNESPDDGSDEWLYRRMLDFRFRYVPNRFRYVPQGGITIGGSAETEQSVSINGGVEIFGTADVELTPEE